MLLISIIIFCVEYIRRYLFFPVNNCNEVGKYHIFLSYIKNSYLLGRNISRRTILGFVTNKVSNELLVQYENY